MSEEDSSRIGIYKYADLRRIARDIIDSYHYDTDFLAELVQNSADAVRVSGTEDKKISVEYDAPRGIYTVLDNGIGMSKDDLKKFAIGQSDKATQLNALLIGEKGVGGSYVLLISDYFEVESAKNGKKVRAVCENARECVYQDREPELRIVEDGSSASTQNYTKISVRSAEFKSYSEVDELILDLRMFTAIGNTRTAMGECDMNVKVTATVITQDAEGKEIKTTREDVPFCFFHPALEYEDLVVWYDALEKGKRGRDGAPDLPLGVYGGKLLAVRDSTMKIMAVLGDADLFEKHRIEPMIVLGVKGAPMPVEIRPPKTGGAGYWRNLFVLINNDAVELDVGRKSVSRKDKIELDCTLKDFFNKYVLPNAKYFMPPKPGPMKGALDQMKEQAQGKEDLYIPAIPYAKVPSKGEELAVMAQFHELLGSGRLKGYQTLYESQDAPYDAIVRYTVKMEDIGKKAQEMIKESYRKVKDKPTFYAQTGFFEFKVDATDFIKDCESGGNKSIEDVMVVVAYDLNRKKMRKGWRVEAISEEDRIFDGTKFCLIHEGFNRKVPLVLIREFRHLPKEELKPARVS